MKLSPNIKLKPWWLRIIPWAGRYTAQAIYPNIYFPKRIYEKLISGDQTYIPALLHEQEHIKRQRKKGWLKWAFKYTFSGKFRFNEEIAADIPKFRYMKKKGIEPHLNQRAKWLSSWIYLWPVSYETAKRKLERVWKNKTIRMML
jgi:hypothetical protein